MGQDCSTPARTSAPTQPSAPQAPQAAGAAHLSLPSSATLLRAKIRMELNRVMAMYLGHLEQLADEHDEAMGKLMDALPEAERAKVQLANIYGEARFEAIRRYVLKAGNDCARELEETVEALRLS